jgi:hypothetical protein
MKSPLPPPLKRVSYRGRGVSQYQPTHLRIEDCKLGVGFVEEGLEEGLWGLELEPGQGPEAASQLLGLELAFHGEKGGE